MIRCNGTTLDLWVDSTTADKTGQTFNVADCTGAPTDGRYLTRAGIGTCLGDQLHAALIVSDAAESNAEVTNIIDNLNAWKALL